METREVDVRDALLVIDVISDFGHEDGEALLASFCTHHGALARELAAARERGIPVLYVNDSHGSWDWDVAAEIERATDATPGGALVASVAPLPGEVYLRKPRYSAFDHTALEIVVSELEIERLLLVGAATEMCIVQTAIDARELGLKVTILSAACSAVDADDAALALAYAERVVGARVQPGSG
jgi:nicotinamidase-related amidase